MAAVWYPPTACAGTTTFIVLQVATDTVTVHGNCTCHAPREARTADEPMPKRALERLRWLERRGVPRFRGAPAGPTRGDLAAYSKAGPKSVTHERSEDPRSRQASQSHRLRVMPPGGRAGESARRAHNTIPLRGRGRPRCWARPRFV